MVRKLDSKHSKLRVLVPMILKRRAAVIDVYVTIQTHMKLITKLSPDSLILACIFWNRKTSRPLKIYKIAQ